MIDKIRNSTFYRLIWGLLALHLLNVSIDNPDPNPNHIPEDLTYNEQESIVEFVIEKLLGFENAIAEYDDPDTEEHSKKKTINIDWVVLNPVFKHNLNALYQATQKTLPHYKEPASQAFCKIFSPPPEV
ncbi:hypothetical protein SY27_02610 [Flavobacterium sp. 316]|uniref:hypothetical protein n=1 Tax=Flavobacterium sp. 316 TaxID=1603293 RepID=UPI0005E99A5B|nr:hypothetical protein [Flavobacterium sp. 316]KIX22729.1 hypothetical protein SY27_02610 [Flavobacterium sp. 316]